MIEELPVGQESSGETRFIRSTELIHEILTQPPLAEVQANEERQGNLLQEYEQRFEKWSERRPEVIQTVLRSRLDISRNWTILLCSSVTKRKRKSIFMQSMYTLPRDQEGTPINGWIQSIVRFGPVSDIKVCNQYGTYSIEVQVQSLFQDQTVSWIGIVDGIDKICQRSNADPRGRESFGETRCKSETYIKTVTNKWLGLHSH